MNGTVVSGFEPVRDAFARNFDALGERGAGVVVYRDGHKVVDLWAGTRDVDGDAPWEQGTAQIMRSATKGVAAAALLLLHQRGALDLDAPVGDYWPEFKQHGKERVLVRDLLAHRAGVPLLDHPLTPAEAADPDLGAAAVADQAPVWEPGTDHGYHAQTYSWLTGELVRRITGRTVGAWTAENVTGPVAADLWVGLPAAEAHRAGRIGPVEPPATPGALRSRPKRSISEAYKNPDSVTRRAFGAIDPLPDENDPAYRAAELPASNGIGTADGLARVYASLIGDVDGGSRLLTPETMEKAREEASAGPDRVLVVPTRFGLGYMLHGVASPLLGPGSFGHPGRGGALGFADPESGIAFGYVTNGLQKGVTADPRAQALVKAVRASLAA
ncbi:serine hydrolase domain-containing protein [Streptomyces sp. NPDC046821]|uniref:serine hydrolase domain-containing protein n=1 Tax=Streptomyces sp. NPDC046821 TaxID=3154702 RepID=UPI0033D7D27F